jgi:hypothetical protein
MELPPTLGQPHEGFFYPDPMGFWAEVRRWAVEVTRLEEPGWGQPEALSVTSLLHVGEEPERLAWVRHLCRPRVVLFLDEPSWERSGIHGRQVRHHIRDPYRPGQVYEGFWGTGDDGLVVGKAPQHPAAHSLYRAEDMTEYLREAPLAEVS